KAKGVQGVIEIQNPNLVKPKTIKARDIDIGKTSELSRREREEIEKQRAHERYMKLQEQGKTEQSRKDLDRLALIRQERAEAAKKREEEKAAKEQKKAEARK
ncbi:28 kDa heat- and acid-stable phosphoprotein-like, partial [Trifolium medium]|nr:28 kDa heat- and acid-stable phosphoprotein-like [Trifolium medium]